MASTFTAAAVAIPTFTGLKVESGKAAASSSYISMIPSKVSSGGARASVSTTKTDMRKALVAATVSVGVLMGAAAGVGNANAIEVLMGSSGGELVFIPKEFQVGPGEPITFKNNAGFPHNIIFDEDDVPPGVDVNSISMSEEDLLNAPGETYTVKLDKKGSYRFYCSPHQGSGMSGKVVVE